MDNGQNSGRVAELTFTSLFLGTVLALVMCAANTYLGLYAGMTVSASIPAAVISMGILKGLLKRGTILENNIVQSIASSGESLAAGVIFTVPALVIAGVWKSFNYWETTLIAATGGLLGVVFMIPLRRALIVEEKNLQFPEGRACAEVLDAGDRGGEKVAYVFASLAVGALFKFCVTGVALIRGTLESAWRAGKGVFYFGSDLSPALLGVGYIVGFNVSTLMFIGGCIGWIVAIPLFFMHGGTVDGASALDMAWNAWSKEIRYMGVGAMAVGGLWSIIGVRQGMAKGLREIFSGFKSTRAANADATDRDISPALIFSLMAVTCAAVFALYLKMIGSVTISVAATAAMFISSFFFVAVSSYIVGLVGSSNNPVSGMTICTVLATGLVFALFGLSGAKGVMATLCVAGVVCGAICSAADISQDLKTGYLVGASPRAQQIGEIVGAIAPALIVAPILIVLQGAYGIGTGAPGSLKAPQATLFAGITTAIFSGKGLPWVMVGIGAGIGIGIIALDEVLKRAGSGFRTYIMPVAVGIYLPFSLSVPVFIGGLIAHLVRKSQNAEKGVLCASGLIAGEAITGIVIGAVIYFAHKKLPVEIGSPVVISFIAAAVICMALFAVARSKKSLN